MAKKLAMGGLSLLSLVVLVLAVALAEASAKPREVVTLRALFPTAAQHAHELMISNFERVNPSIHIDAQFLPATTVLTQQLLTQFQAGNAPDLFFSQPGSSNASAIWPLAQAGRLLDLTGRKWQKRVYPEAIPVVSWNNKIYAWPLVVHVSGLLYNTDLFKQLNLKVPTRFSGVLSLCKQITAAGKIPFAFGAADLNSPIIIARQRISQYVYPVDPKWNDKREKKQVTFASSPLWRRALQSIVDMKDAGCFPPGASGITLQGAINSFANGDAVMMAFSTSLLSNILLVNPNLHYAMANLPPDDPKYAAVNASTTNLYAVNATTKYPAQAKAFIDFVTREQQSQLFAKVALGIAPLDVKKGQIPNYMKAGLAPLFKAGKIQGSKEIGWSNPNVFLQGMATGVVGLFTGQTTVDSILQNMDKLWDNPTG